MRSIPSRRSVIVGLVLTALLVAAVPVLAATSLFDDVPDDSIFVEDINWMKTSGITNGCNAAGTEYCPGGNVTRQQMAAFMHRFAQNLLPVVSHTAIHDTGDLIDTSNPRVKKMETDVTLTTPGTLVVSGGVLFSKTYISHYCWLVWNFQPDRPLTGGVFAGSDRGFTDTDHHGMNSCQTSGAVDVDAGTYRVSLMVQIGTISSDVEVTEGNLHVTAVPNP
jgi:hypothetical protein